MLRSGLLFLAVLAGLAGVCGDGTRPRTSPIPVTFPATIPADLTLEQVYERMGESLQQDGKVLHTRVVIEDVSYKLPPGEETPTPLPDFDFKEYMEQYAGQLWFFEEDGVLRMESWRKENNKEAEKSVQIVREKTAERDGQGRPTADPLTCRGTTSALLTRLVGSGRSARK